jgi:hypothetical protein
MCSLFVHHLDPEEAVLLFSKMRQAARRLVVVNDLVRSQWAYAIVWLGTRLLSRSPVVQFDGPVSVQAAYTTQEMRSMAIQAGMTSCAVKFCLPCRQVMTWTA